MFKHYKNPTKETLRSEVNQTTRAEKLDAKEVIESFREAGLQIDKVFFITKETDFENLLGKLNQYVEKAEWIDTRIKENSKDNHVGGVIEISETEDALEIRSNQIKEIEKTAGIKNYQFTHKNILLRLDNTINEQQAYDYEIVFKGL